MSPDAATPPPTVTYFAISILNSKTFRLNAGLLFVTLVPLLVDPDLVALIPVRYLVLYAAFVKVANIVLRLMTVRPVVLSAPGTATPVQVERIDPPTTVSD
jgi:hypothetical protein